MMPAAVQSLRPPPPERGPERAALATAIERHRAAADRLARTRAALGTIADWAMDATAARQRAETALADARDAAPAAWINHLIDGGTPPSLVADAEAALAAARENDDAVHRNQSALQAELGAAEQAATMTKARRDDAVRAVVAASGASASILADYRAAIRRVVELAAILDVVPLPAGTGSLIIPGRGWAGAMSDPAAQDAAAAPWRAWIAALAIDPEAEPPGAPLSGDTASETPLPGEAEPPQAAA